MLKIGEFSKLSHLTVKTLRFYEAEGLLVPAAVDPDSGYRFYETDRLMQAAQVKCLRRLGLSVAEVGLALKGEDIRPLLLRKACELQKQREGIEQRLAIIDHLLKEEAMTYQVVKKEIPACIVYSAETVLPTYADAMSWIPQLGQEMRRLNPDLACAEPPYEFCEYLDGEYQATNVRIRHSEAVVDFGVESDGITFREIPATTVLSVPYRGAYDGIGGAYAYLMKYAQDNGYEPAGLSRECYIDGIWNKESVEDWLTEIQLPIA